jgi:hypothetical protein
MRNERVYIVVVAYLAGFSAAGLAVENLAGIGTVPPSSYRNGLIVSSNPVDTSGNLLITGNVTRGAHFRGIVPYRTTSDFTGTLGSASLDSFLRDSASSRSLVNSRGGYYNPYFSPTRTVTGTRAGTVGVVRSPSTSIRELGLGERAFRSAGRRQELLSQQLVSRRTEISSRLYGLDPILSLDRDSSVFPGVERYVDRRGVGEPLLRRRRRSELLREHFGDEVGTEGILERASLAEDLRIASEPLQLQQDLTQPVVEVKTPREAVELRFMDVQEGPSTEAELTEAAREHTDSVGTKGLRRWDGMVLGTRAGEETGEVLSEEDGEAADGFDGGIRRSQRSDGPLGTLVGEQRIDGLEKYGQFKGPDGSLSTHSGSRYEVDYEGQLVRAAEPIKLEEGDYRERAREIMGKHESFASYLQAKLNEKLSAGEVYLRGGEYYRASGAYSSALVYDRGNILALAGKGHALLGAGEYISSVLFISQALAAAGAGESGLAGRSGLMVRLAGNFKLIDKDTIESRIVEIGQWQQHSGSGELQFLLSYIYYQMGRFERAKEALAGAYEEAPEMVGLSVLKQAIDSGQ